MAGSMRWRAMSVVSVFLVLIVGCATQARYYSSVVDYLYPGRTDPVEQPAIPVMSIPMKVAIAFVPDIESQRQRTFWQEFSQGLCFRQFQRLFHQILLGRGGVG